MTPENVNIFCVVSVPRIDRTEVDGVFFILPLAGFVNIIYFYCLVLLVLLLCFCVMALLFAV